GGREDVEVDRGAARRAGARGADLVEHQRGLGDAEPGAAVFLRDRDAEPAIAREGLHEVARVLGAVVLVEPVVEGEGAGERPRLLPDQLLRFREREVHWPASWSGKNITAGR